MFIINPYIYSTSAWENLKSILTDGVDEYVNLGGITMLESTANFSISFWYKPVVLSGGVTGVRTSGVDGIYTQLMASGQVRFTVWNGIVFTNASVVTNGTWYKIDLVYDGSLTGNVNRAKIYIDSVYSNNPSSTGTIPATRVNSLITHITMRLVLRTTR